MMHRGSAMNEDHAIPFTSTSQFTGTWPECQTRLFAAATGYAARSDHPEHIFRAAS